MRYIVLWNWLSDYKNHTSLKSIAIIVSIIGVVSAGLWTVFTFPSQPNVKSPLTKQELTVLSKKPKELTRSIPVEKKDALVFLSSTSKDLKEYRDAVYESLNMMNGVKCVRMEDFLAADKEPIEISLEKLSQCTLLVGVVAHNYGSIPDGLDVSITHMEYQTAKEKDIPRLMFVAKEDFPVPANLRESDFKFNKQQEFRKEVLDERSIAFFDEPNELAKKVSISVSNYLKEGVKVNLKNDKYVITVETSLGVKTYIEEAVGGEWYFPVDNMDRFIKRITIIPQSTLNKIVYDFTKGIVPEGVSIEGPGPEFIDRFAVLDTGENAIIMEGVATNHLLHSDKPSDQVVNFYAGTYGYEYVLWMNGSGHVDVKGPAEGVATEDKPFRFKIYENGTLRLKVNGDVDRYQLEGGSTPTGFIPTDTATVTRTPVHLSLSLP